MPPNNTVAAALAESPPPGLQEAVRHSTVAWQQDLEALFKHAKDRFPDVVWELVGGEDDENDGAVANGMVGIGAGGESVRASAAVTASSGVDEVWGHKAIVYARAPPSFQSRYFSFRGNEEYPTDSTMSLGLGLDMPASMISRSPSPYRSGSPAPSNASPSLLRITTSINPALFSNELEYLYTGQGFGEAFEFLFDSSETREAHHLLISGVGTGSEDGHELDAEALRIDKLRKDLVFMWRSRLYSDVRIALTGNFSSSNHENTTAIFSSHRFILVSRCPYFHSLLLTWPQPKGNNEPPTLTLPSPPFTPASLHFTLGYVYTGTLVFSHRSYDLSTAFALLRSAMYLGLTSLHDEVQARIAQEMLHGLFHAFLPFAEYEKITQSKWGTGGCRCRQCARRAPRVLEFSLEPDVRNAHFERGARRAMVGMFGEGWCTQEFASLNPKLRESLLRGLGKRVIPSNAFSLLFAAEHAIVKLGPVIEPWGDTVRDAILAGRKMVDECIAKESHACFETGDWMEIMESEAMDDGASQRFGDKDKVEWAMASILRGVKEPSAGVLYQTLVSSILLRPHPTEETEPMLSATSGMRGIVEETRLELLKWIGKRWIGIRQDRGFDELEGWALKEISDHIEVPIEDLISNGPTSSNTPNNAASRTSPSRQGTGGGKAKSTLLRPISQHPHTSRIDSDSDLGGSMRASVLTRNSSRNNTTNSTASSVSTATNGASRRTGARTPTGVTPARGAADNASIASSVRSSVSSLRSTATFESSGSGSTVGRSPAVRRRPLGPPSPTSPRHAQGDGEDSPAKRIAASVRARNKAGSTLSIRSGMSGMGSSTRSLRERPDSKLTPEGSVSSPKRQAPSIVESQYDDPEDEEDRESVLGDGDDVVDPDADETASVLGSGQAGDGEDNAEDGEKGESDGESTPAHSTLSATTTGTTISPKPVRGAANDKTPERKKVLITKASLSSVTSRGTNSTAASRVRSSGASLRSVGSSVTPSGRKTSGGSTLSASTRSRPNSRSSTRSTATTQSRTTTTSMSQSSRSTLSSLHSGSSVSRPVSRSSTLSTVSNSTAGRPVSNVSVTTDGTFRTASTGGNSLNTPVAPRARKTSASSTVSVKSTGTARTASGDARQRKVSTGSTTSVASHAGGRTPRKAPAGAPPVPAIDLKKLNVKAPSIRSTVSLSPTAARKTVIEKKKSVPTMSTTKRAAVPVVEKQEVKEKENTQPSPEKKAEDLPPAAPDHRKTASSASTSSVATVTRRGSVDTITKGSSQRGSSGSSGAPASPTTNRKASPPLPPVPMEEDNETIQDYRPPRGDTFEIGIPCIISSKRKRFKAYARYIGEVEGETGPWVGVEVPLPVAGGVGDPWGDRSGVHSSLSMNSNGANSPWPEDDRQWNDGSWGGVRYFEIGGVSDWGEDRVSRRRRVDGGSAGSGAMWGTVPKGSLKREGDVLGMSLERMMKRVRSASPAGSETSSMTEGRGLFVRPHQVLYVVDAVGANL
ncbi:hypothetical protein DFP72DRAFT_581783 [Ephemerocybe angulata]|uniref:BTB domain-containing protein n=1 Tax=Ephemerocybe angulata TaxID=980116 RepID=A0A8H6HLT3_9AGAR|nr:hypothetical protein DFP72DRAFT_581783 [Tulosesus angulatus]